MDGGFMRLKSKTYGLFLASLGHILAPLPFLSAAHATENKIEACGSLFSSQSPLDLHKAFQFQTLTDHTNKQIYNYAMNRSQMYTRGLVFIGADNAADARSLFSTFKAGDRLRFHGIYSLDERSEHYIGKTVHSLHELEMLTQMASNTGLVERVILIGTLSEFEQFSGKLIDQLFNEGESKANHLFWEIFPTLAKTNIFVFRSAMKEESYNEKFFRYMAHAAYDSQGKMAVVEYSAAPSAASNPQKTNTFPNQNTKRIESASTGETRRDVQVNAQPNRLLALPAPKPVLALPAPGMLSKPTSTNTSENRSYEPTEQMKKKAQEYVQYRRNKLAGKEIPAADEAKFRKWIDNLRYRTKNTTDKIKIGNLPYTLDAVFTEKDQAFLISIDPYFFEAKQNQASLNQEASQKEAPQNQQVEKTKEQPAKRKYKTKGPSDEMRQKAQAYVQYLREKSAGKKISAKEEIAFQRWIGNIKYRSRTTDEKHVPLSYKLESLFTKNDIDFLLSLNPHFFSNEPIVGPSTEVLKQAEDYVLFIEKMKKSEWVTAEEAKARTRWLAEMNALMELPDSDPKKIRYSMDDLFTNEQKRRMGLQEKDASNNSEKMNKTTQTSQLETVQDEISTVVEESVPQMAVTNPEHDQRRHAAIASLPEKARSYLELITERIRSDEFEEMGEDFLSENTALESWFQTFIHNNRSGVTKYAWVEYFTYEELLRLYNYTNANTPNALIQIPESVLSEVQQHFPGQIIHRTAHHNPHSTESTPELVLGAKKIEPKDKSILQHYPLQEKPGRIVLPENTKGMSALEIAARALEQMEQHNSDLRLSDHPELAETPVPQKTQAQIAAFKRLKKSVEAKHKELEDILKRMEGYFTALHLLSEKGRITPNKLIYYTDTFQAKKKDVKDIHQRIQDADELNHLRAADVMMISIRSSLEILEKSLLEENKNMGSGQSTFERAQKDLEKNQDDFNKQKENADQEAQKKKSQKEAESKQMTLALQKAQAEIIQPQSAAKESTSKQQVAPNPTAARAEPAKKQEGGFLSRMLSFSKTVLGLGPDSKEEVRPLTKDEEQILQRDFPILKNPPTELEKSKIQSYIDQWNELETRYTQLVSSLKKYNHGSLDLSAYEKTFTDWKSQFQVDAHLLQTTDRGSQLDKLMKTAERLILKMSDLESKMQLWMERFQTTDLKQIVTKKRPDLLLSDRIYSFTPSHIQKGMKSETIKVRFSQDVLERMFYDLKDEKSRLAAIKSLESLLGGFHDEQMDMFRPQRASTPVIVRVKNVGHGIGKIRMYGVLDSNTENDKGSSNVRESVSHKLTQVSFVYTDESENFDQTQLKRVYDSTRNASAKMNGKWKSKF